MTAPSADAIYNHTTTAGDHAHARHERGQLVLIVTGGAEGSIPRKAGGIRLPHAEAAEMARFILASLEDGGASIARAVLASENKAEPA